MMSAKAAQEHGMRINSVCPSPIDTPLLPDFGDQSEKTIDWCRSRAAVAAAATCARPRFLEPMPRGS